MTLQLASDIALTAEIIDAATGLVALSEYDVAGATIIDAEYTIIEQAAPLMLAAPTKKVYSTPYRTRGQFFKMLREEGKLGARTPSPAKAKGTDAEAKPTRQRSAAELAAIRRHYASARNAA